MTDCNATQPTSSSNMSVHMKDHCTAFGPCSTHGITRSSLLVCTYVKDTTDATLQPHLQPQARPTDANNHCFVITEGQRWTDMLLNPHRKPYLRPTPPQSNKPFCTFAFNLLTPLTGPSPSATQPHLQGMDYSQRRHTHASHCC